MPNYILAYHSNGNMPKSPEEGAAHMERYKAWLEGMGEAVVNPGTPLKDSKTVSADGVEDGGGPNPGIARLEHLPTMVFLHRIGGQAADEAIVECEAIEG